MKNFKDFELDNEQQRNTIGKGKPSFAGGKPEWAGAGRPEWTGGKPGWLSPEEPVSEEPEMEEPAGDDLDIIDEAL